ncbi:sensor histidine kinase [Rhodohalobacter sp. 614A]|uniref:sensor histidine kinase n=1 Tax=Rhodohalobacter sp. 614A TaxID=2908649 RepID=UPI001F1CA199|nr:histidine kinase dimerization/phosphoacceptor domain -containing protein [Rhodohalobacter sp. 614A]
MAFLKTRVAQYFAFGVIIVSTLIMGFIIYELSNTKHDFATQLITQSSTQLQSDLDEFFLPVENLMMTLKHQQRNRFFQNFDTLSLNNYYIPIIDQYPQVSSVAIANNRGYEFNIIPDSTADIWLNREVHVDQWGMIEKWDSWTYQSDSLHHIRSWQQELENDPRTRPWFTGALNHVNETYWTEPYLYITGDLGLTAASEWTYSETDTLHHIIAIDVTLKDLSKFSQKIRLTENNQNFILTSPEKKIVGLPQSYNDITPEELAEMLMTPPDEFEYPPLVALLEHPENQIVHFDSQNERWWGIIKPYSINSSQELLLAVIVPESDFSSKINSTRNAVIIGFLIIFLISILLVRNYNKLRVLSNKLNDTNKVIEHQKQLLFSEVHHRVKNNLAIISALINIESMQSEKKAVQQVLSRTQKRIQSMSSVHEILYKSDNMSRVSVKDFVPEILELHNNICELKTQIRETVINVNQALTYALLLNELMTRILKSDNIEKCIVDVQVEKSEDELITDLKIFTRSAHTQADKIVVNKLNEVLLNQLNASFEKVNKDDSILYRIRFKLEDKRGSTSNQKLNL